jgi:hypothetical protein
VHRRRRSDRNRGGAGLILPIDPAVHQQLELAVEQCRVPVAEVVITYEDLLQSEQILVKSKSLPDQQLQCLSTVQRARPYPVVIFENGDLTRRNYKLQSEQARVDAREWLQRKGLLSTLPSYDPNSETILQFAKRMEQFCGIERGSMLTMHPSGILTIKTEWAEQRLKRSPSKSEDEKFECLMNAMSASNLEELGFRFGFVGNEAYSTKDTKK